MKILPSFLVAALLWFGGVKLGWAADSSSLENWHKSSSYKVLKAYTAKDGDYIFRSYAIEWKGQEVIAEDVLAQSNAHADDTIEVLAMGHPYPKNQESYGLLNFTAQRPKNRSPSPASSAALPGSLPPVQADLKVLKIYAAQDGPYTFRAYVVEWQGQEVIARDVLVKTNYAVGDTIQVLVMKQTFPQGREAYGLLHFMVLTPSPRIAQLPGKR